MTSVANTVAMTTLAVHTLQLHFCTGWLKELASEVKTYRTRNPLPYGIIGRGGAQSLPGSSFVRVPRGGTKNHYIASVIQTRWTSHAARSPERLAIYRWAFEHRPLRTHLRAHHTKRLASGMSFKADHPLVRRAAFRRTFLGTARRSGKFGDADGRPGAAARPRNGRGGARRPRRASPKPADARAMRERGRARARATAPPPRRTAAAPRATASAPSTPTACPSSASGPTGATCPTSTRRSTSCPRT